MGLKDFYEAHKRFLLGTFSIIVLISIWEVGGQRGKINPLFFAWPSTIAKAFYDIVVSGELFRHFSVSFYELVLGYGSASLAAIALGVAMGRSKTLEYLLDPILSAFYAAPRIALMPVIILIFGIGLRSKIFLVFLGCFFPILVNVLQGMKSVDPLRIDMARVFGAKGFGLVRGVFIPSILPYMVAGFRIALSVGLIMVVVAEFFAGNQGIGYKISYEAGLFNADALMAWVIIISFLAIFFTELIKYFEKKMNRWK